MSGLFSILSGCQDLGVMRHLYIAKEAKLVLVHLDNSDTASKVVARMHGRMFTIARSWVCSLRFNFIFCLSCLCSLCQDFIT